MKQNVLKRAWNYVWHGESTWSLLLSILLVFVIVRFIVYPAAGFILGTQFPVVAVVSGSMEHQGLNTEQWWSSSCCRDQACTTTSTQAALYDGYNIIMQDIASYRFPNGFNKGDIMILSNAHDARVGDTLVFFSSRRAEPIIHRIIRIDNTGSYRTKGDNNCAIADFEEYIPQENVVGKAIARIPWLGYIKIWFVKLLWLAGIGNGI